MRIDPKLTTVTPVALKTARDQVAPQGSGSEAGPLGTMTRGREDRAAVVELSTAGAAVADARPADPGEKVARLRELIDRGEYKVDLDLLAQRLVEDGFGVPS